MEGVVQGRQNRKQEEGRHVGERGTRRRKRIEEKGAGAAVSRAVRCCQDDEWEASAGCEGSDGSR